MVDGALSKIKVAYEAGGREVVNNGHAIQVDYDQGSTISLDGHEFELKQFHFHSPSENTINGQSYPLEAHFVHGDKDGNLAVIAVMFEEGKENAELEKAWAHMPERAGERQALSSALDANNLLPRNREYYRFSGSLTTPPCSEGVWWLVMKEVAAVSKAQVDKFARTIGHPNNRPIQPLNARMIVE